jgi:hypothetical protein
MAIIKEPGFIQIIQRMFAQARKGSFKHQELLLYYILGKPTDHLHLEGDKLPLMQYNPVVKIIADTLRLERLEKDKQTAGDVPQSAIDEAEGILNKAVEERVAEVEMEATPISKVRTNGTATLHRNGKKKPKKK